jgi:predicted transcriptional regulator
VAITPTIKRQLEELAAAEKRTESQIVQFAITAYLEKRKETKNDHRNTVRGVRAHRGPTVNQEPGWPCAVGPGCWSVELGVGLPYASRAAGSPGTLGRQDSLPCPLSHPKCANYYFWVMQPTLVCATPKAHPSEIAP